MESTEPTSTVCLKKLSSSHESESSFSEGLETLLDPIGGWLAFPLKGARVLLKPNQTLFKSSRSGSTTSPLLIRALIHKAFECGAAEVWVAEASGHAQQSRDVMAKTGMVQAVKGTGAHCIFLDEIAEDVFDFGEEAQDLRFMPAPEIFSRADVIINVPKAKTHFVDPISGAVKNWVGVIPMSYRLSLQKKGDAYYRATALFLKRFKPTINVFDGAIAGQGQGPGQNHPFWWGYLLASMDPVAADTTLCRLFDLDWKKSRMGRAALDVGVGVMDPKHITVTGEDFEEARTHVIAADPSVKRYPCRVIVGEGVNIEGTVGHWKTIADAWLEFGIWKLFCSKGRPTFMFGKAEDPDFEEHLKEGPYVVLDDAALDKYKLDPRVVFVPGSPVPQSYIQQDMVEGMGFGKLYETGLKVYGDTIGFTASLSGAAGGQAQRMALTKLAAVGLGVVALKLWSDHRTNHRAHASLNGKNGNAQT